MTIYFAEWKEKGYECGKCAWQGSAGECVTGRMYRGMFLDLYCPSCQEFVDLIVFPESGGCGKKQESLSDEQRRAMEEEAEQLRIYRESCLQSAGQLPEVADAEFTLKWDQRQGDTVIAKGDLVVWSEPLVYEGFGRFETIALILREKYGERVRDLIPTGRSQLFLYGDYAPSIEYVAKVRRDLFGSTGEEVAA